MLRRSLLPGLTWGTSHCELAGGEGKVDPEQWPDRVWWSEGLPLMLASTGALLRGYSLYNSQLNPSLAELLWELWLSNCLSHFHLASFPLHDTPKQWGKKQIKQRLLKSLIWGKWKAIPKWQLLLLRWEFSVWLLHLLPFSSALSVLCLFKWQGSVSLFFLSWANVQWAWGGRKEKRLLAALE